MYERQSTRNEALASLLGRISVQDVHGAGTREYFLERRGEGVPIIREETKALTGRDPVYDLIDGSELRLILPAAPQNGEALQGEVSVHAEGKPLKDVAVYAIYPKKTWQVEKTDSLGQAHFNFHSALPITVFCAIAGYAAHVERDWNPPLPLAVELKVLANGGSVIFPENTGNLPGLKGRLNPKLDTHDRTYIYASNIAIDGGKQQPVQFTLEQPLRLTDAEGCELKVRIIEMIGNTTLLEYERLVS